MVILLLIRAVAAAYSLEEARDVFRFAQTAVNFNRCTESGKAFNSACVVYMAVTAERMSPPMSSRFFATGKLMVRSATSLQIMNHSASVSKVLEP